jgi:hypothetical protein
MVFLGIKVHIKVEFKKSENMYLNIVITTGVIVHINRKCI